ncbi:hypothetical protein GCM10010965_31910 [Caldalkalibacillus thermarum]|uniref:hypothetical protein n=1 Tax=Caldalkalibacillus thermarum TaxID=296745 RepID=UPI00166A1125|nr:hypothetical protein [Caldalkalibacillus thermarum]GGK36608.1 hypothetical protein GCM10010965_31910 [Caldalkalibacillus thermarum]
MFGEIMSFESFVFLYWFAFVWFFVAAAAIYIVVIRDTVVAVRMNKSSERRNLVSYETELQA